MIRTGSLDHYSAAVILAAIKLAGRPDVDPEDTAAAKANVDLLFAVDAAVEAFRHKSDWVFPPDGESHSAQSQAELDRIIADPDVANALDSACTHTSDQPARDLVEVVIRTQDAFTNRAIVESMHDRAACAQFRDRALKAEADLAALKAAIKCEDCNGSGCERVLGRDNDEIVIDCSICGGTGYLGQGA